MAGILVIISSLFYGFSNAFWKRATENLPFYNIIFFRGIITSSVFGILWCLDNQTGFLSPYIGSAKYFSFEQLIITISLCLMSGLGLFFFVKSMKEGVVNLVAPLSSINIFGLLTATFVLREPWKSSYWLPITITVLGLSLIFFSRNTHKLNKSQKKALIYGILASIIWGFDYTLFKIPLKWMGVLPFSFLLEACITIFSFCIIIFQETQIKPQILISKHFKTTSILAICLIGGSFFMHLAYLSLSIAEINFFAQSQLVFTLFFGAILYKEKLAFNQCLGIILLIIAIGIISTR